MKAEKILTSFKEAAGGDAWDRIHGLYLRYAIRQGGLAGTRQEWRDLATGRFAHRHRLGITAGAEGFDGTVPWTQDVAGYPRIEESADAREGAANNSYRTSLAYWYPDRHKALVEFAGEGSRDGRICHILRVTPAGGRPFDLWIDTSSGLPAQTVERGGYETVTRSFSDYRQVGKVLLPFRVVTSNGYPRYDQEAMLQEVEFNPAGVETHLAIPGTPAPDFEIEGDSRSVEIPFQLAENLIVVEARVNGRLPLPFVVDTGAVNLVTPEAAHALGLSPEGAFWGFGAGEESVDMQAAAVQSIEVGGLRLRDQIVWVYPFPELKDALGLPEFGGLLGYELFRRLVAKMDYGRKLLTLIRPEEFTYRGSGAVVPFDFHHNVPEVEGALDGIEGRFDLDTGNSGALVVNGPFAERHGLFEKYDAGDAQSGAGSGGGPVTFCVTQARSLRLGAVEIEDLPIALCRHQTGALSHPYIAGFVGADVFRRFTMIFDYTRRHVVFERPG